MKVPKNFRTLDPIPFTKEGYENVKLEHAALLESRKAAVDKVKTAREFGDLSENAAYHAARQNLFAIDRKLRHLKMQLVYGTVSDNATVEVVGIGCIVKVTDGKTEEEIQIVGQYEVDPIARKFSLRSPLGQALAGKKVGDTITFTTPSGVKKYTVITISR